MSGRLRLCRARDAMAVHTHVVVSLNRGQLRFSDPRRFGDVGLVGRGREQEHRSLRALGIDALDGPLTGDFLHAAVRDKGRSIKLLLLDQSLVAGIGNIYASEALWQAQIRPTLPGRRLSRPRAQRLVEAIREVLRRALEHGGTSLSGFRWRPMGPPETMATTSGSTAETASPAAAAGHRFDGA